MNRPQKGTFRGSWAHLAVLLGACVLAGGTVGGCTQSTSSTYDPRDVGKVAEASPGWVVASRIVEVRGETSQAGITAGGALGAAGSGLMFESLWAPLIGAVVGAGAGYASERAINAGQGIEYVLSLDDGRTVTLVQNRDGDEAPIADGTPVLVQFGGHYARVMVDPRGDRRPTGSASARRGDRASAQAGLPPPPPPLPAAPPGHGAAAGDPFARF